jgi:hypothetical protein
MRNSILPITHFLPLVVAFSNGFVEMAGLV